jgi:cyclophilin family peptidyl-prolyl cis-trans isomerase
VAQQTSGLPGRPACRLPRRGHCSTTLALALLLAALTLAPATRLPAQTRKSAAPAAAKAAAAAGGNKLLNPAALNETAPALYKARLTTTKGDLTITVHRDWAPLAADRFYNLVKNGFYDGTPFHRVHPSFVAQFGLNKSPAVQAKWEKAPLKDEPVRKSNQLGMVSFAALGPDSRTTQIFISMKDNKSLDKQGFPPFGDVTAGIGVLARIYGQYGDKPDQQRIIRQGAGWLKAAYPQMDYVTKAVIE